MRTRIAILMMVLAVVMTGCKSKQAAVKSSAQEVQEELAETWHTCKMTNAQAVATMGQNTVQAKCNLMVVRDSMLVISVMPMMSIEMMRVEATPEEVIVIDKINTRFIRATYDEINNLIVPSINWKDLQELVSGESPTGDKEAVVAYSLGKYSAVLKLTYPTRVLNEPVRMIHMNISKYRKIDINSIK